MKRARISQIALAIGLLASAIIFNSGDGRVSLVPLVHAQTLTVQFAVDHNIPVTIASGNDKGDQIRITGGRSATVDSIGCVQDNNLSPSPIQEAVVVDPAAYRATRLTDMILISQQTPLPAGTKIDNVFVQSSCHLGSTGVDYIVYQGTIE